MLNIAVDNLWKTCYMFFLELEFTGNIWLRDVNYVLFILFIVCVHINVNKLFGVF